MRVRICRRPTGAIDGVSLDQFRPGMVCDLGSQVAALFLAEGWAEPVDGIPRVLVVEDDPDLRRVVSALLVSSGYVVIEAHHGAEALRQLTKYAPDLVVLDLNMPVMDGWEFRAEQQRMPNGQLASVPVVLVTGAEEAERHAAALKAAALVTKPFEPDGLLSAISTALRRGGAYPARRESLNDG